MTLIQAETAFSFVPAMLDEPAEPQTCTRILHVEDNAADLLLTQEYVRGAMPSVEFDSAVRLADVTPDRAAAASCAILDLSLPDATGLEALIALRAMCEHLPIIVLTGLDDLPLGLTALRDGADDYLVKNHVDGYTLERAIRYAIERRGLLLEVAREAAAATLATTVAVAASSALDDELIHGYSEDLAAQHPEAPAVASTAVGTHAVTVRIDGVTGDYSLECQSCAWQADEGSDDRHTWAERSLDWLLLHHVDFGGTEETPVSLPRRAYGEAGGTSGAPQPPPPELVPAVGRRELFSPRRWLKSTTSD